MPDLADHLHARDVAAEERRTFALWLFVGTGAMLAAAMAVLLVLTVAT
jgi:hypothetical protein